VFCDGAEWSARAFLTLGRDRAGLQMRHWSKGFKTHRQAEHALAQLLIEGRVAKETSYTLERIVSEYVKRDFTPKASALRRRLCGTAAFWETWLRCIGNESTVSMTSESNAFTRGCAKADLVRRPFHANAAGVSPLI
jgi:hypothetical protein